jgi:hypothetical protein
LQVTAADQDGLPLTFTADGLPDGLVIDPQSGLISGTIAAGAANGGPYFATVTATDGTSSDSQSFFWGVASAVAVTPPDDQQNGEGDAVSLQVTAADQNGLPLTYSADGLPDGLVIDPQTGLISGTIAVGAANGGPYFATVTATDGTSSDSQSFFWDVASPVSVTPVGDQQNNEGDEVSLQVTAADQNGLDLTFSADGLPDGLSIDPQSGLISGTIATSNGLFFTTVTASDGTSSASQSFFWSVGAPAPGPVNDPPPWVFGGVPWRDAGGALGPKLFYANQVAFGAPLGADLAGVAGAVEATSTDAGGPLVLPIFASQDSGGGETAALAAPGGPTASSPEGAGENVTPTGGGIASLVNVAGLDNLDSVQVGAAAGDSQNAVLPSPGEQLAPQATVTGNLDAVLGDAETAPSLASGKSPAAAPRLQGALDASGDGVTVNLTATTRPGLDGPLT